MKRISQTCRRSMPSTSFGVKAMSEAPRAPEGFEVPPPAVGFLFVMSHHPYCNRWIAELMRCLTTSGVPTPQACSARR